MKDSYQIEYNRNGNFVNAVTAFTCKGSYYDLLETLDKVIVLSKENPLMTYRVINTYVTVHNGQSI